MTDHTRWVENRLEQLSLNYPDIVMAWFERKVVVTVHGDIEDPQVEVEWK